MQRMNINRWEGFLLCYTPTALRNRTLRIYSLEFLDYCVNIYYIKKKIFEYVEHRVRNLHNKARYN